MREVIHAANMCKPDLDFNEKQQNFDKRKRRANKPYILEGENKVIRYGIFALPEKLFKSSRKTAVFSSNSARKNNESMDINNLSLGTKSTQWPKHENDDNSGINAFLVWTSNTRQKDYMLEIESSDHKNNRCSIRKSLFLG
jgi:hypothetical protein